MTGATRHGAPRRMSGAREAEILAATLERLGARGYEALTIDEVAAAARMSKATLYRQWGGKAGLVRAALEQFNCEPAAADTGSLRGDLVAFAASLPTPSEERSTLLSALVHVARDEGELAGLLDERIVHPHVAALETVFGRAIARGELVADHALVVEVAEMLVYAELGRVLLGGRVPDRDDMVELVDRVVLPLLGLAPAGGSGRAAVRTKKALSHDHARTEK